MQILDRKGLEALGSKKKLQAYGQLLEPELTLIGTLDVNTMIERILEHQENNGMQPVVVVKKEDLPEDPEKPGKGERKLFPWGRRHDMKTGEEIKNETIYEIVVRSMNPNDTLPIDGGVNGVPFRIKQGVPVKVPASIYEALRNANVVTVKQDLSKPDPDVPGQHLTTEHVQPTLNIQVLSVLNAAGKKVA
jgi:hypothetical protein